MKKYLLLSAIINTFLLHVPTLKAQQSNEPASILRKAIDTHSDALMRKFFESWLHASNAIRKKAQTSIRREAEAIFDAVWNPKEFQRISSGRTTDTFPPRLMPPYIVILPSVHIRTYKVSSDSLRAATRKIVYEDEPESNPVPIDSLYFMAQPQIYGAKTLFYLKEYLEAIDKYMRGSDSNSEANTAFIGKYVSISCHMMGCVAIGIPEISSIIINQKCTRADVPYRLGGMGGTASLSKIKGKWRVTSASMSSLIE